MEEKEGEDKIEEIREKAKKQEGKGGGRARTKEEREKMNSKERRIMHSILQAHTYLGYE